MALFMIPSATSMMYTGRSCMGITVQNMPRTVGCRRAVMPSGTGGSSFSPPGVYFAKMRAIRTASAASSTSCVHLSQYLRSCRMTRDSRTPSDRPRSTSTVSPSNSPGRYSLTPPGGFFLQKSYASIISASGLPWASLTRPSRYFAASRSRASGSARCATWSANKRMARAVARPVSRKEKVGFSSWVTGARLSSQGSGRRETRTKRLAPP